MLVISRRSNESFNLTNGLLNIHVRIIQIDGKQVKIGIDAPDHIKILRSELKEWDESKRKGEKK